MNNFKTKVQSGETVLGIFNNIDSSIITEIIGLCEFDWILLDTEHRPSSSMEILHQLQSLKATPTFPVVRVPWLDRVPVKVMLDAGASGIMFPSIDTKEQAEQAVSFMRYAPQGVRGVSAGTRACNYGLNFSSYFNSSNEDLLVVTQIETQAGIDNIKDIANVEGVDVLFVGPVDLSTSINLPKRFEDKKFIEILKYIAEETKKAGKIPGIQIPHVKFLDKMISYGYSFIALSSDVSALTGSLKEYITKAKEIIVK